MGGIAEVIWCYLPGTTCWVVWKDLCLRAYKLVGDWISVSPDFLEEDWADFWVGKV